MKAPHGRSSEAVGERVEVLMFSKGTRFKEIFTGSENKQFCCFAPREMSSARVPNGSLLSANVATPKCCRTLPPNGRVVLFQV